jgi:hypothetical protein
VVLDSPNARFGIITSGKAYLDVMQALEDMGITPGVAAEIGLRVYKVGMPWPLEPQVTHDFAEGLEEILVVEEKRSVIEDQLTGQLYNYPVASRPRVVGEFDEQGRDLLPNLGELTPAIVALAIAAGSGASFQSETMEQRIRWIEEKEKSLARPAELAERVPHFCSGCPHNTSTRLPRAVTPWVASAVTTWPPGCRTGPPDLHADGRRGRDLDRPGAVHGHASRIPEPRRRHLLPLGDTGRARGGRLRCQHHLQDSLQRRGGDDRGAARRRFPDRAGAARSSTGRACAYRPGQR